MHGGLMTMVAMKKSNGRRRNSVNFVMLADGRRIAYQEKGVEKRMAKRSLLVLHGVPSSLIVGMLGLSEDLLREMGVRLVSIDRPGYSLSDFDQKQTYKVCGWRHCINCRCFRAWTEVLVARLLWGWTLLLGSSSLHSRESCWYCNVGSSWELWVEGYIQDRKEGCNEADQSRFKEVDKTCQDGATMHAICIHSLHSCSRNGKQLG